MGFAAVLLESMLYVTVMVLIQLLMMLFFVLFLVFCLLGSFNAGQLIGIVLFYFFEYLSFVVELESGKF